MFKEDEFVGNTSDRWGLRGQKPEGNKQLTLSHGNGKSEVRNVLLERSSEPNDCLHMTHRMKTKVSAELQAWGRPGEGGKEGKE